MRRNAPIALALLAVAALGGCASPYAFEPFAPRVGPADDGPVGPPLFEDMTPRTGIDFTYKNGEDAGHFAIIESLGGGVALIDFDKDGRLDVFLTGGGHYQGKKVLGNPCRLYRNLGGWKFEDVTKQAGLDVYQDGNPYVLHHKVFVLDGKTTIFGSFNFSDSADRDNDENALIVDDPSFAARYLEEVGRMLTLARNPSSVRATPDRELPR